MVAKPLLGPGPKRILYLVDQMSQCAWYRCSVPGNELAKLGHDVGLTVNPSEDDLQGANVVVFLRHFSPEALQAMRAAKSARKLVVYDIDDALWELDPTNPAYPFYSRPEIRRGIEACIRAAHLVTTTTEALAKKLKRFNERVVVLPNMLPDEAWPYSGAKPQNDEHVIVGFAGDPSHGADLEMIRDVGAEILEAYPNVWLVCAGINPPPFAPHPRLAVPPWVPIEEYGELLRTFDIGIAPLVDTEFNRSKSDLKVLEYSMAGIPVVASDVGVYSSFVKDGETGFLVKSPQQWSKTLRRLIEDRGLREEIGGKANAVARERLISSTVGMWTEAYGIEAGFVVPTLGSLGNRQTDGPARPPWNGGDFVDAVKGRHAGETCYIVGKGPSLLDLGAEAFGPGPVICLNESILHVQELKLDNKIYSMQKDGCEGWHQRDIGCEGCEGARGPINYPEESVTVLLHEHESRNCLPDHPNRLVFDAVDELGFGWWSTSAPCAIRIAKIFGCEKVVLLCHDSFFGDYGTADITEGKAVELVENGPGAENYEPIRELVKQELAGIDHEVVPTRAKNG